MPARRSSPPTSLVTPGRKNYAAVGAGELPVMPEMPNKGKEIGTVAVTSGSAAEPVARATAERERRVRHRARHHRALPARFAGPPIAQNCRRFREALDDRAGLLGPHPERLPQTVVTEVGALAQDQESPGAIYEIHESGLGISKACAVAALAFRPRPDYTGRHLEAVMAEAAHDLSRRSLIKGAGLGLGLLAAAPVSAAGPPAAAGPIWSSEYWAKKGDVSLHLFRKRAGAPKAGEPPRPVLFLVHGSSISARPSFDLSVPGGGEYSLMNVFARWGYDVWTMDHEGYGRSSRTDGNSDIASGVEDLRAGTDVVARETGQPRFHFSGSS